MTATFLVYKRNIGHIIHINTRILRNWAKLGL